MKEIIHEPYILELEKMIKRMKESQELANRFKCFENYILAGKVTYKNGYTTIGMAYKDLHMSWGVKLGRYGDTNRKFTNYNKDIKAGDYISIYINSFSLFDSSTEYGLSNLKKDVFYFDKLNSTFYIEADKICEFMPKLHAWYTEAKKENCKRSKQLEIEKLEEKIKSIKNTDCE